MNQELFDLINTQTGKVLVQSELNDIINLVLRLHPQQDVQGLVEALVELIAAVKCSDGGAAGMEDVSAAITSATLALKSYQEWGL